MPQPTTLSRNAVGPGAGALPWASRREARLRPEHAALYPGIRSGVWESAAVLVDRIVAGCLLQGRQLGMHGRVLSDEHFEFRGGPVSGAPRPRREDR